MADRSSRPHAHPNQTPRPIVRKIKRLRITRRLGPVEIGGLLQLPPATVHAVLVRERLNRLSHIDRKTGEPARRYEHPHPSSLIHVDVKKLGNIPDGGGWRTVGRVQGGKNRAATPGEERSRGRDVLMRHAYVHTVIDDHSRVAYAEIHDDERAETAIGVLQRAESWFQDRGVLVERVLSDNGSAYRSHAWRDVCSDLEDYTEVDAPVSATDERENRAVPSHPRGRVGVQPALLFGAGEAESAPRVAALL